jgi:nucleotide-binding universal stress UspA family protein
MEVRSSKHVLVVYDGSLPSRSALRRTSKLAAAGDAVTVINVMPYPAIGRAGDQRAQQECLLADARETLARAGLRAATIAAEGDPAIEVLAAADGTHADLVVIGRDRARFPHVAGEVSGEVVRHAVCDVLVVRDRDTNGSGAVEGARA